MRLFQNASIQRKQMLVIMLTSLVALLLACAGFIAYEIVSYRTELVWNLTSLAQMIGDTSSGALDFNDPKAAEDTLSALRARPNITAACIYTKDGSPFAKYIRGDVAAGFSVPKQEADGHRFTNGRLILFHSIELKGDKLGWIYLESDLERLTARLKEYAIIVTIVVLASMLAAFLLSFRLQRWLSEPILQLAKTARAVALEKNYSLRATKQNRDELGLLTDDFNAMLNQIQQQDAALQSVNESLERRVEERTHELESSLSLIHATIESTADGILVVDRQGRIATYNKKFVAMWRISESIIATGDDERLLMFILDQLEQPEEFLGNVRELYAHPDASDFDTIAFKDGRVFERYSLPQYVGKEIVGRVWDFRDISDRTKAETKLENLHRQLQDTSRQAGMAEVATNVLHNVGNVLNSVNVSSALVSEKIRESKVSSLAKAVALLRAHQNDLAAFLTQDPKGMQLCDYLDNLAQYLGKEQTGVLKELESLNANIEHIKEIVTMQQSYARAAGIVEILPIVDVVEDALRMNDGALTRHQVQVIRDYSATPSVPVDKHKAIQILVNLVRNAKYALDEGGRNDKLLTVRVATDGDSLVKICVIDNGVGIPGENLTRIFSHGFTTRKNGHGFGLHGGSLAAKEMGGSLSAHSDGPGQGATFTLSLPLHQEQEKL